MECLQGCGSKVYVISNCMYWVHRKGSGITGSQQAGVGTCKHIEFHSKEYEDMSGFCYLGDDLADGETRQKQRQQGSKAPGKVPRSFTIPQL